MNSRTYAAIEADLARVPIDPEDLAKLPPVDLDACDVCGGDGAIWPLSLDPQDVEPCPACGGDGFRPELGGAA